MGPLFQRLSRGCNHGISQGWSSSEAQLARIHFQVHMVIEGIQFCVGSQSRGSPCYWLSAGIHSQFLAMWVSPYGSLFPQSQQRRLGYQDGNYNLGNMIMTWAVMSHYVCHILLAKSKKSQVPHTFEEIPQRCKARIWGSVRAKKIIILFLLSSKFF